MAKQIKLKPTQRLDLNWMINKTCVDNHPEYQDENDVFYLDTVLKMLLMTSNIQHHYSNHVVI